ncbi:hypothetical protein G9A89_014232 [Geosiphon pyriformis]|nr:hypothetical protein G9A89_014232 [Geosiphon pyriformis]
MTRRSLLQVRAPPGRTADNQNNDGKDGKDGKDSDANSNKNNAAQQHQPGKGQVADSQSANQQINKNPTDIKPLNAAAPTSSVVNNSAPIASNVSSTGGKDLSSGSGQAVPTGSISNGAIAGLCVVGGCVILAGGFFALIRKKKHQERTSEIVAKSASAFEAQSSNYEKMEEEVLQPIGRYTVVETYTPTLADELEIQPGDKVTVFLEYDDGWVQGLNETRKGAKGVFPRHCIDMNIIGPALKSGKRSSSINVGYHNINLNN